MDASPTICGDRPAPYSLMDDYSEGAHPDILEALARTNETQQMAYGDDEYCGVAKEHIRRHIGGQEMAIHFVPTGTSANLTCIASCLQPFEAVIATSSAHIATQEAGAIAALGHHIILIDTVNGKAAARSVEQAVRQNDIPPHTVLPRLLYISNSSEAGTVYSRQELVELAAICKKFDLIFFMDGARLGTALCSPLSEVTLREIFELTDIFWIGGTKNGALFGEAVIIKNQTVARNFAYHVKQRGGLLAKGRVFGIQFTELFRENLFFDLASHANKMAQKLSNTLNRLGYHTTAAVETNQIFAVMPRSVIKSLQERYYFHIWEELDDDQALIRLVTSWATDVEQVEAFKNHLEAATTT